jgi:diguanylate cyclase (GGDEF)-like protein
MDGNGERAGEGESTKPTGNHSEVNSFEDNRDAKNTLGDNRRTKVHESMSSGIEDIPSPFTDPQNNLADISDRAKALRAFCEKHNERAYASYSEGKGEQQLLNPEPFGQDSEFWHLVTECYEENGKMLREEFELLKSFQPEIGNIATQGGVADKLRNQLKMISLSRAIKDAKKTLQKQENALTDEVTGLWSRKALYSVLGNLRVKSIRNEIGKLDNTDERRRVGSVRHGIIMIDGDHLKAINDTLGHAAGDKRIRELGQFIRGALKNTDFIARLGGDEYVAIVYHIPEKDAEAIVEKIAENIRSGVEKAFGDRPGIMDSNGQERKELPTTVSVGATIIDPRKNPEDTIGEVDGLMMKAKKEGGRNVVWGKNGPVPKE